MLTCSMKLLLITPLNRSNITVCQTVAMLLALLLGLPGRTMMISGHWKAPLWEAGSALPTFPPVSADLVLTELLPQNNPLSSSVLIGLFVLRLYIQSHVPDSSGRLQTLPLWRTHQKVLYHEARLYLKGKTGRVSSWRCHSLFISWNDSLHLCRLQRLSWFTGDD